MRTGVGFASQRWSAIGSDAYGHSRSGRLSSSGYERPLYEPEADGDYRIRGEWFQFEGDLRDYVAAISRAEDAA